jgi:hypothetical protein
MTSKYLTVALAEVPVQVESSGTECAVNPQPACCNFIEYERGCALRQKTRIFVFNATCFDSTKHALAILRDISINISTFSVRIVCFVKYHHKFDRGHPVV